MPDIRLPSLVLALTLIGCGPDRASSGSTSDSSGEGSGSDLVLGSGEDGDADHEWVVNVAPDIPGDDDPAGCGSSVCDTCGMGLVVCMEPITVICETRAECEDPWIDACDFYGC